MVRPPFMNSLLPRKLHYQLAALFSLLFAAFIAAYTLYAAGEQYALMEHTLSAPYAGVVSDIYCTVGEQVKAGVELIAIEEQHV